MLFSRLGALAGPAALRGMAAQRVLVTHLQNRGAIRCLASAPFAKLQLHLLSQLDESKKTLAPRPPNYDELMNLLKQGKAIKVPALTMQPLLKRNQNMSFPMLVDCLVTLREWNDEEYTLAILDAIAPAATKTIAQMNTPYRDIPRILNELLTVHINPGNITPGVELFLQALVNRLQETQTTLEPKLVSRALVGIQNMDSDVPVVRSLLAELAAAITRSRGVFRGHFMVQCVHSLESKRANCPEVLSFIKAIASIVRRTKEEIPQDKLADVMFRLRDLPSSSPEVGELIDAITVKISQSTQPLSAESISWCTVGMVSMSSDDLAVRRLSAALAEKIKISTPEFTGLTFGKTLNGMQGLSTDHAEVRQLVSAICDVSENQRFTISGFEVANALFGLQRMSTYYSETRRLLRIVSSCLEETTPRLDILHFAHGVYGLGLMSNKYNEVKVLLMHLLKHSYEISSFTAVHACKLLQGMRSMDFNAEEVQYVLWIVVKILESCEVYDDSMFELFFRALKQMQPGPSTHAYCAALVKQLRARDVRVEPRQLCRWVSNLRYLTAQAGTQELALIDSLTDLVHKCETQFEATHLAKAIWGMQLMNSEQPETVALLDALSAKLESSVPVLTAKDVSMVLIGLRRKDINNPAVKRCIRALNTLLTTEGCEIDVDAVSLTMDVCESWGLECVETRELFKAVAGQIRAGRHQLDAELYQRAAILFQRLLDPIKSKS